MRYGLQFADGNPFPQDVNFGIQLEDETIVVPEECPECPPPAAECEVVCRGWYWAVASASLPYPYTEAFINANSGFFAYPEHFTGDEVDVDHVDETAVFLVPIGQFCGHKIRIVFNAGSLAEHTYAITSTPEGSHVGIRIVFTAYDGSGTHCGTVNAEIDLTDAPEGEETWTPLCGTINVCDVPAA